LAYPLTAIVSDTHGNAPALEAALADAAERGARRVVCLGDVVGYGADPRHNLRLVMRLCTEEPRDAAGLSGLEPGLCLMGNHEHALLNDSAHDFNPRARAAIDWTRSALVELADADERHAFWDFLGGLEPSGADEVASFAHGSPRDPVREYLLPTDGRDEEKMRANFAAFDRRVCFVGHSHVPAVYRDDGRVFLPRGGDEGFELERVSRVIVNVGSVGQPRDGDPRLSYVMFDGNEVTFVRVAYDVEAAADAIRAVPELSDSLAERLAVGR